MAHWAGPSVFRQDSVLQSYRRSYRERDIHPRFDALVRKWADPGPNAVRQGYRWLRREPRKTAAWSHWFEWAPERTEVGRSLHAKEQRIPRPSVLGRARP